MQKQDLTLFISDPLYFSEKNLNVKPSKSLFPKEQQFLFNACPYYCPYIIR